MTDLSDFEPLTTAEQALVDGCSKPQRITIGDGELPEENTDACQVRTALIRHILLNRTEIRLDEKGLRLRGAWIIGGLDLQGVDCRRDITFVHCQIDEPLSLVNATLRGLHISHSQINGVSADNAAFSGSVFIRNDTVVNGEISLAGARISGDLQICGATLKPRLQDAIFAPSLRVGGNVFLGNYPYGEGDTTLTSQGTLFFASARIEHDFFVTNVAVSSNANENGNIIFGATEEHGRDMALSLARARINGLLFFQNNQISQGIVNLAGATVARLKDEPIGPGASYPIRLDGFKYSDFSRHTDTSIDARLGWLARRPDDMEFTAQPYEQLSDVLEALGHRNDAQTVLMHKERLLRQSNRMRHKNPFRIASSMFADLLLRWTIGYGYRPARAVVLAVILIVGLGLFYQQVWNAGDMAPNSAPILISEPWISATQTHPENPALFWSGIGQAGQDWETFSSFAYAADLVIPIVNLGEETAWAPSTSRSPLGRIGWWLRWFAKGLGWVVTALGAAAITGIIRKD